MVIQLIAGGWVHVIQFFVHIMQLKSVAKRQATNITRFVSGMDYILTNSKFNRLQLINIINNSILISIIWWLMAGLKGLNASIAPHGVILKRTISFFLN